MARFRIERMYTLFRSEILPFASLSQDDMGEVRSRKIFLASGRFFCYDLHVDLCGKGLTAMPEKPTIRQTDRQTDKQTE